MKTLFSKLVGIRPSDSNAINNLDWLNTLNSIDDISAIQTINKKLTDLLEEAAISDNARFKALLAIDEHCHPRVSKIAAQYVKVENLRSELETDIWETVYYYYRHLYNGYCKLVNDYTSPVGQVIFSFDYLPLILMRAIHAGFMMIKWRYFRQQAATEGIWLNLHRMYQIAEQESLTRVPVEIYPGTLKTNMEESFAQAWMLDNLSHNNMSKQDIEIAHNLLGKWFKGISISKSYEAERLLYFADLAQDKGGRRIRNLQPVTSCRYWETEPICARIQAVASALEEQQSLEKYGLEELQRYPGARNLLKQLYVEWSRKGYRRQRRQQDRKAVIKTATIAYGIENACLQVKQIINDHPANYGKFANDSRSLEDRIAAHSVAGLAPATLYVGVTGERWTLVDEGALGYGALVSQELEKGVRLGKLIAMVCEDSRQQVVLGIIRSIKPQPNSQRRIGIQIISRNAIWIQLSHVVAKLDVPIAEDEFMMNSKGMTERLLAFSGLYIPPEAGLADYPSILIPRMEFQHNGIYQVIQMKEKTTIQLSSALEAKDDWARVACPALI
ncbi:MAG: hypothetical protein ABI475_03795 [Methylophilaceae bacterium]